MKLKETKNSGMRYFSVAEVRAEMPKSFVEGFELFLNKQYIRKVDGIKVTLRHDVLRFCKRHGIELESKEKIEEKEIKEDEKESTGMLDCGTFHGM